MVSEAVSFSRKKPFMRSLLNCGQIYFFTIRPYPFFYLGGTDELVYQMIDFVKDLPAEWQSKWQSMKAASELNLESNDDKCTSLRSWNATGLPPRYRDNRIGKEIYGATA